MADFVGGVAAMRTGALGLGCLRQGDQHRDPAVEAERVRVAGRLSPEADRLLSLIETALDLMSSAYENVSVPTMEPPAQPIESGAQSNIIQSSDGELDGSGLAGPRPSMELTRAPSRTP